jgi:geranylgeranyl diphosphate synthase type II
MLNDRIEKAIQKHICSGAVTQPAPTKLRAAIDYTVFPGGARIRPLILTSVALACGDDMPSVTDAAASALEFIHCASLVHDDLPCFDNSALRRGKPTVHRAFGETTAVLAGDSLIVNAFAALAAQGAVSPGRVPELIAHLARYTGFPNGICAGQAWEDEAVVDLGAYHLSKTGALFIAATQMGAIAAGHDPEPWQELGARIGQAFQIADDLLDVLSDASVTGKPMGQDLKNNRPSAVTEFGVDGAKKQLRDVLGGAIASIPSCPGEAQLAKMVQMQSTRMMAAHQTHPHA